MLEPPENPPEEAEDAAGVGARESEAAQEQIQVVAIGVAHRGRGVVGSGRGLGDNFREEIEIAGCGWEIVGTLKLGFLFSHPTLRVGWGTRIGGCGEA